MMKLTTLIYRLLITIYRVLPFKKYICLLIRFLGIPNEKFYRDLTFKGKFKLSIDNTTFKLHHYNSTIENELFWKGSDNGWEKISLSYWMKLCKNSSVILDIGANTGIYSLIASGINSAAIIYAFEPSFKMRDKLDQNIQLNGFNNVHVQSSAVSNKTGMASFFDFKTDHQYSASLNKEMIPDHSFKIEVTVPVVSLDHFISIEKLTHIDLIKIDVEMHEVEVLEGFREHLKLLKPTMFVEILTDEIGNRIEAHLENLGYLYFNIDEEHAPVKVEHLIKSDCYNFLICQPEIAKQLLLT